MQQDAITKIHLRYALRDGQPVHVRQFEYLRGDTERPKNLHCPECEKQVTIKLPKDRQIRDHFAHYPDSDCPLRNAGESAYHLNAKIYLAERMREFHNAALVFQCRLCRNKYPYLKINDYDEVVPEMKLGRCKPDVTCLHARQAVGVAEIFHTHAVDVQKQYDLNAMGVAWFEIPAASVHPRHFGHTEAADVLAIDAQGAGVIYPRPPPICEVCETERQRAAQKVAEDARWEADWARVWNATPLIKLQQWTNAQRHEAVELLRAADTQAEADCREWEQRDGAARLSENGELITPTNALYQYRYWQGGQPLVATLAELSAPLATWRRYAAQSDDLLSGEHAKRCRGEVSQAAGVVYCADCGYFAPRKGAER